MLLKSIRICSLRRLLPLPGDRFLTANHLTQGQVYVTLLYIRFISFRVLLRFFGAKKEAKKHPP